MMLNEMFKSVLDMERSAVVLCNLNHEIVYMNPAAVKRYENRGGAELLGKSLLNCHNEASNRIINEVIEWFGKSPENNMIYTYKNVKENKDVYMVALRDEGQKLIGYYEKHEYRNAETVGLYDFSKSLV